VSEDGTVTLFGLIALSLNFLNSDQLAHALEVQEQEDREGKPHRWLGLICIELGYLKAEHIGLILQHQSKMAA
jgi:hypothetical protein